MNKLVVLVCVLMLSGCAIAPYIPLPGGESATIDYVVNNSGAGSFALAIFEGENCTTPKMIADGAKAPQGVSTIVANVRIPTGRSISFLAADIGSTAYCAAPFEFAPEANKSYVVTYQHSNASCSATVAYRSDEQLLPESTFRPLRYKEPTFASSPFCEK